MTAYFHILYFCEHSKEGIIEISSSNNHIFKQCWTTLAVLMINVMQQILIDHASKKTY